MQVWHFNGAVAGLLLLLINSCLCAKIIHFVPTLSYSHVAFNGKLAEAFKEKGHNVTIILIDVDPTVSSTAAGNVEVHRIDVNMTNGILPSTLWHNPGPFENASPLNPKIMLKLTRVASIFVQTCKNLLLDKGLIFEIKNRQYDIGVVEQYDMCGIGFLKLINVKSIIWLSATGMYRMQPETMGINYPLSYVPELFAPLTDKMSLIQRLLNAGIACVTEMLHKILPIAEENRIFKRLNNKKHFNLFKEASYSNLILANIQPFLDFPAPTSNNIFPIGGLTVPPCQKKSKLNPQWREITDIAPFFIITFGSIAKTIEMPKEMQRSLFRSFKFFPQFTFIVKYENITKEIQKYSENVYLAKWLPQIDLICHSNYYGIITHGGWSTVLESLSYARPMILMPLFADHFKNANVIADRHLGIIIDKSMIHKDTFTDAIEELVTNQRYSLNSAKFAKMLKEGLPTDLPTLVSHGVQRSLRDSRFSQKNFRFKSADRSLWRNNSGDIFILLTLFIITVSI
uniref:Glucuronosyltransferase n=1 Tax=Panagrolaimus sp. PS1159 TaxID=55785 RepID=A0AC35GY13_9BILA